MPVDSFLHDAPQLRKICCLLVRIDDLLVLVVGGGDASLYSEGATVLQRVPLGQLQVINISRARVPHNPICKICEKLGLLKLCNFF